MLIPQTPHERTAFHLGIASNTRLWYTSFPFSSVLQALIPSVSGDGLKFHWRKLREFKSHRSHELLISRVLHSCAGGEYASFPVSNVL